MWLQAWPLLWVRYRRRRASGSRPFSGGFTRPLVLRRGRPLPLEGAVRGPVSISHGGRDGMAGWTRSRIPRYRAPARHALRSARYVRRGWRWLSIDCSEGRRKGVPELLFQHEWSSVDYWHVQHSRHSTWVWATERRRSMLVRPGRLRQSCLRGSNSCLGNQR